MPPSAGGTPSSTLRVPPSAKNPRTRTMSTPAKRTVRPPEDEPPLPSKPSLSIREQIALRRAEAKKSTRSSPDPDALPTLEDAVPTSKDDENAVDLGRWSVKETIERARSTGESDDDRPSCWR